MERLAEVLDNKQLNYIFPFLWLHGEKPETILATIHQIYNSGAHAFCLESRPHPDFLGKRWWSDLDLILHEAQSLGMKVWILDDSHFPTGYANGRIKKNYPQYLKRYLSIKQLDFCGPQNDVTILLKYLQPTKRFAFSNSSDMIPEKILKVIAAKKTGDDAIDAQSLVDITDCLEDGLLNWNIPVGEWRIFTLIETVHGGEKETEDYLNPLVAKATAVLLDEVYNPHYQHYHQFFGKVIAGFFSDEPRFGNHHGAESRVGIDEMNLPWRPGMLEEFFNEDYLYLPLLTNVTAAGQEKKIRYKYMDLISRIYADNFTNVLSNWCHKKHIEYIGHLIEDNGAHTRVGYGAGHYFRALDGQDMAGIDVVLNQIMPGMDKHWFKSMTKKGWNGEFFNYGLAKLGASLGHLDSKKHGRVMSEVFGAYGWAEGLTLMKFIADHMLVRGVNYFVPHAFNSNDFPDPDCPPHFYAAGQEPESPVYSELFNYMNRLSHILSGGKHVARVAVLYHAENEWLDGITMPFEKPVRELMQHQIECEVTPLDYLKKANLHSGFFEINGENFSTLVIPQSKTIPNALIRVLQHFSQKKVKIIFIDSYPLQNENLKSISTQIRAMGQLIPLAKLASIIPADAIQLRTTTNQPYLRFYHYCHEEQNMMFLFNESPSDMIEADMVINMSGPVYGYNAVTNDLITLSTSTTAENMVHVHLSKGETILLVNQIPDAYHTKIRSLPEQIQVKVQQIALHNLTVALANSEASLNFSRPISLNNLTNINKLPGKRTFSGTMKYQADFELDLDTDQLSFDFGVVNEIAILKINGHAIGTRIAYPYNFRISSKYLKKGTNELELMVINNLGIRQQDFLSQYIAIKPAGWLGPLTLSFEEVKKNGTISK